jgi:uncharacterized protein YciI
VKLHAFGLFFLATLFVVPLAHAEDAPAPAKPKTFVYVLHLVTRLHDDNAWTKEDGEVIGRHFQRLKEATGAGTVVFVGRTTDSGDKAFGLVVFEAAGADEAKAFADSDPAVTGGIMTVDVHPFALVLQRK